MQMRMHFKFANVDDVYISRVSSSVPPYCPCKVEREITSPIFLFVQVNNCYANWYAMYNYR